MMLKKMVVFSMLLIGLILISSATMAQSNAEIEKLADAGRKLADKLGLNPVPAYIEGKETIILPGKIVEKKGGMVEAAIPRGTTLAEGDMLINVGSRPLSALGVTLGEGEYAILKSGTLEKQPGTVLNYKRKK